MSYFLLVLLVICLLYFAHKQKVGYFVCFSLLFFRIATTLFYSSSTSLYTLNSLFLGISYVVVLIWQFNYFNRDVIIRYYNSPVVISMVIVSLLMIVYNYIGPYYAKHSDFIREQQLSYLINVFIPFILLPFFVSDSFTRNDIIPAILFWGIFYVVVALTCFDFKMVILRERELLKDTSDNLIGSIMLSKYMAIVAIVAFLRGIASEKEKSGQQVFYYTLAALFLLFVVIAGQRGTLFGIGIALFVLLLRDEWRNHSIAIIGTTIAISLIVITFVDLNQFELFQRLSEFQNIKHFNRYYDYFNTWDIFKENDFFWGLGTKGYFFRIGRIYPHNIILEHISDYGLLGLICILTLLCCCAKYAVKLIRYSNNYVDLSLACIWIIICFSAMVSDSILGHRLFYLFSGLLTLSYRSFATNKSELDYSD